MRKNRIINTWQRIITIAIIVIILIPIFNDVARGDIPDTMEKKEARIINTDPNLKDGHSDENYYHSYNIADSMNASNFSNAETWEGLKNDIDLMYDLFGSYETDYENVNITDDFIFHSTTVIDRYIKYITPFEYIDTISLWLIRNSVDTNITLTIRDYFDGVILFSINLNDSDLELSQPTRVNISLGNCTITGMAIIQIEGWGTISIPYCEIYEEYQWDIEPEIHIYDAGTGEEFDYIIPFFANGTKLIDGVWIGGDLPPSIMKVNNYETGIWANVFQIADFPAKAISSGSSYQCIRLPWLHDPNANYKLTVYQIDSPSTLNITMTASGNFALSQLCHPVLLGIYTTITNPQHFFDYTSTIDGYSYSFQYVLTYFPIYPNSKYLFVSSYKNNVIATPYFMVTESDIGGDDYHLSFLNVNSTMVTELPIETELSLIMISGMAGGVTGYKLFGMDNYSDSYTNSSIDWYIPLGPSNPTYDYFSFVMPIRKEGAKLNISDISVRINITFFNSSDGVEDYKSKIVENLTKNYILGSWNISTIASNISYIHICLYFYTNGSDQNSSVTIWLSDPHNIVGYIDNYDATFMTARINEFMPKNHNWSLNFIPYSYARYTDGELIEFDFSGYTFLKEEEFYAMYDDKEWWECILYLFELTWTLYFKAIGEFANWVWGELPDEIKFFLSLYVNFLILWWGTIITLFALWFEIWIKVMIPLIIESIVLITEAIVFFIAIIAFGIGVITVYKFLRGLELLLTDGPKSMILYYSEFTSKVRAIISSIGSTFKKTAGVIIKK